MTNVMSRANPQYLARLCDARSNQERRLEHPGNAKIDRLEIKWPQPSGKIETFADLPIDRYITVVEGAGIF